MAKQIKVKIEFLKKLRQDIYLLGFNSLSIVGEAKPGQFVHIKVDEKVTILRRPFSIHKISKNMVYILFRVRGKGTKLLAQCKPGNDLDIIGPLGNGFNFQPKTVNLKPITDILVAGGMGVAPLIFLAEKLAKIKNQKSKIKNVVLLGAKNKNEVLAEQEFKRLGFDVRIATDDGSRGTKGTVTDLLKDFLATGHRPQATSREIKNPAACIYACGPKEMFYEIAKIIKRYRNIKCQVSFEQFMGCGLGVCCGCTVETKQGYKKACKDGPVFDLKNIK